MTGIELYSTTAASNNSAAPNGWPEGQAPSTVNDCGRQMMAAIRTYYESSEWINWGDTTVYVSGTSFKIAGSDVTSRYTVGRRVKAVGSSTGTIYGKIVTSAFSTDTTITVVWDTGSLSNETLTISIGAIKSNATGAVASSTRSIDFDNSTVHGADVASASTINLDTASGNIIDVTGTTTITAITLAEGRVRKIRFTGILTFTHGASLVLPGAANITTAAGDTCVAVGYAAGVVRIFGYQKASGLAVVASSTDYVRISTQTASTSASLTFTSGIDSTYGLYIFEGLSLVPATDDTYFTMEYSVDGGSNWLSSSYVGQTHQVKGSTTINQTAPTDAVHIIPNSAGFRADSGATNDGLNFTARLINPSASNVKYTRGTASWFEAAGAAVVEGSFTGCYRGGTGAVNAIRFKFSSGNIVSGSIIMCGLKIA